jgi:thiol-disulfide isomerase/thioredoxin
MSRVIFYHMDGCPHCAATWPAWKDAKEKLTAKGMKVEEKESAEAAPDGVKRFPTFVVLINGKESKRFEGARTDAKKLVDEIEGKKKSRRGGALRRLTYRRRRQLTHRTLRNYKAL